MDGPPAQSLGVEPVEKDVVRQKPRNTKEPMITRKLIINVLLSALVIIAGTLWIFKKEVCCTVINYLNDHFVFFFCQNKHVCKKCLLQTPAVCEEFLWLSMHGSTTIDIHTVIESEFQ